MFKLKLLSAFLLLSLALGAYSQEEGDKVIAIIGNDVILQSDLNFQLYNYLSQNNIQQINEAVYTQVFQEMITEKLILAKAEQDSIFISADEVQKQVDGRLSEMVSQFGSEKNLEDAYGITISKIKSLLADQAEKNIKINRIKQEKFGYGITVS
ncbi:MAG: hypothetical protein ACHQIH_05575, partial [Ignavibacteria bacterium]